MTDAEEHQASRLRVLNAIYDASGGASTEFVQGPQLLEELGLPDQELADACNYLEGERLITAIRTSWGHMTPYVVQMTHRGIKEVENRSPGSAGQERRRTNRLRVLKAIYDASVGSQTTFVAGTQLLEGLGLSDQELAEACDYLEGERLIKSMRAIWGHLSPYQVQITHHGIKEVEKESEQAPVIAAQVGSEDLARFMQMTQQGFDEIRRLLQSPHEPTDNFPSAMTIVNVSGSMIGSAIQSGSPGAKQEVSTGDIDLGAIRKFLSEFDTQESDLDLPADAAEELAAEIATIKAQVNSPKPKRHIIRESLHSVRTILEITSGSAAAVGLLDLLKLIHF